MDNQNDGSFWWHGIIIGASGGLTVWVVGLLREEYFKWRDKKRIYSFMKQLLIGKESEWQFRSTRVIASNVNLTEDRVRYICSIHPKIKRSTEEKEVWRLD